MLGSEIHFIQKPFSVSELIDKIIDVLELGTSVKRQG